MGIKKKVVKKTKSAKSKQPTSLIDALFTSTQQKVLGLTYGNPEKRFFATEIISLVGAGSGAVQRELAKLTQGGILSLDQSGKQKFYSANSESPIFSELRQIILKTVGLIEPIQNALAPLKNRMSLAMIFGSVANNSDRSSSDIDLFIVSDELSLSAVYEALAAAEQTLQRKISPVLYTKREVEQQRTQQNHFVKRILAGPRIVVFGDPDAIN